MRVMRSLAFAVVVAVAGPMEASAACAWVLWIEYKTVGGPMGYTRSWSADSALPSYAACDQAAGERANRSVAFARISPGVKKETVELSTLIGGGYSERMEYQGANEGTSSFKTYKCFPDSIDPRK
jgi:hypothetical protein